MRYDRVKYRLPRNLALLTGMKYTIVFLWALFNTFTLGAQSPVMLHVEIGSSVEAKITKRVDTIFAFPSLAKEYLNRIVDTFQMEGYLSCYHLIAVELDTLIQARIYTGSLYSWTKIFYPDSLAPYLKKSDLIKLNSEKSKWTFLQCRSLMARIAEGISEHGYPYAQVFLDSTRISGKEISARLNFTRGPLILLDTLEWDNDLKVKFALMSRIIGVHSGSFYSKKRMNEINQAIAPYPFIQQYADPDIFLTKSQARVRLYLRTEKSSNIDALLGLLPSADGPLKLNGTFRSDFMNQLGMGERLLVDFRSLQSNTQDLNIKASSPFLFNLPFNPYFQFDLYRRDSLFLDVFGELGAGLSLGGQAELRFVLGQKTSTLLKPDLAQIKSSRALPQALDLRLRHLGANFRFSHYDFERNPRSGLSGRFSVTGSTREIIPNSTITNLKDDRDSTFSFASLYLPYNKNGFAFEFNGELERYTRLGQFTTWQSKLKAGIKSASTPLQLNEQFRLGGFTLIRGFDEESIFAREYYLWTNAIRLLTGEFSYLQVYTDVALVNQFADKKFNYRTLWGIGSGLVFDTSSGLLSLSAAVGKIFPGSFNLRNVKVHIGYINYF